MPHDYQDEVVPPARCSPNDWIVRMDDGAPALASAKPFEDEDDPGRALKNGDRVLFDWVENYGSCDLTFRCRENDGWTWELHGDEPNASPDFDMIVAEIGNWETMMPSLHEFASEYDEKNDGETISVAFYAWSKQPTEYEFRDGAFYEVQL